MYRKCTKCETDKLYSDFAFKNKKQKRLQSICRSCQSLVSKQHYTNNRQNYIDRNKLRSGLMRIMSSNFIGDHLIANPCVDCGFSNPVCLEFHHLYDKSYNIGVMVGQGYSLSAIQREIDKCIVLCANCHRLRTAQDYGWNRLNWI